LRALLNLARDIAIGLRAGSGCLRLTRLWLTLLIGLIQWTLIGALIRAVAGGGEIGGG